MQDSTTLTLRLTEHLTRAELDRALTALALPAEGRVALVVDCLLMTGYDLDARHAFVEWNRMHKERVTAVAILTTKLAWRMVIAGMSLATAQAMRVFPTEHEASAWLAAVAIEHS